jgi:hypothetical protein
LRGMNIEKARSRVTKRGENEKGGKEIISVR